MKKRVETASLFLRNCVIMHTPAHTCVCVCVHACIHANEVIVFSGHVQMREAEGYQYTTKEGADLERTLAELKVNKPVVTMKVKPSPFLVPTEISFMLSVFCVNQRKDK